MIAYKEMEIPAAFWRQELKIIVFLVVLFTGFEPFGQTHSRASNKIDEEGRRQGSWVLYFSDKWQETASKNSAAFYRHVVYKDDLPQGGVKDFYMTGELRRTAKILSDRPFEKKDGEVLWYDKNGEISVKEMYENGQLIEFEYDESKEEEIKIIMFRSVIARDSGDFSLAIKLSVEAANKALIEYGYFHPVYASALQLLAIVYYKTGDVSSEIALSEQAKNIFEKRFGRANKHYSYAGSLLAALYEKNGYPSKAADLHRNLIEAFADVYGRKNRTYLGGVHKLSSLYIDLGKYEEAEGLLLEIKSLYEEQTDNRRDMEYGNILNTLALLYKALDEFEKSEKLFVEVRSIFRENEKTESDQYPVILGNLAGMYVSQLDYRKAEPILLESKLLMENQHDTSRVTYGTILGYLGASAFYSDRYQEAAGYLTRSLNLFRAFDGVHSVSYSSACLKLSEVYERLGNYRRAHAFYQEALSIEISRMENNFPYLSEKERENFYETFQHRINQFHPFIFRYYNKDPSLLSDQFSLLLATKGLLFDASVRVKERVMRSENLELKNLYRQWMRQKSNLASLYDLTPAQREAGEIQLKSEEDKTERLERDISTQSEIYALPEDTLKYNWRDVQKKLKKNEAAVEIIRFRVKSPWPGPDIVKYIALLIKPNTKDHPEIIVMHYADEMESSYLKRYRNSILRGFEDKTSYGNYWKPIQDRLEGVRKVYVSADGVYHSIGLQGLLNPKTENYVIDEIDVQLVHSTRDIINPRKPLEKRREAKLLGFPSYNEYREMNNANDDDRLSDVSKQIKADSSNRFFDGGKISELPGTLDEVKGLEAILKKAGISYDTYIENRASESSIKSWDSPFILHVATHGYFLKEKEILRQDSKERIGGVAPALASKNPLLRSGLLLANAKQAMEVGGDGILTAYEALDLNLYDTELVVLSACETGLGEIKNGEGVYGLQRAFQAAGARSLIMSLWKVDDKATQILMTTFYTNWLIKKQSKRLAFRNAQRSLQEVDERYKKPYFWAAFVMVGE